MSNGIGSRQNEGKCIRMLAAQRQLYSEVGYLDYLSIILLVVLPFIFAIMQENGAPWNWIKFLSYGLSLAMLGISIIITKVCKNKKSTAASIQMAFDTYVFSMPWDERLFGKQMDINTEIIEKSNKIMGDKKRRKALRDWYTPVVDRMPLEKGVLACQKESLRWDARLRKRCKFAAMILFSVLAGTIIIIGIKKNEPIQEVISRFIFILPMARWLVNLWNGLNDDLTRLKELDREFRSTGDKYMSDLQVIQKNINEHRKSAVKIPDVIYQLFKNNDEDREYKIARMDAGKN